VALYFTPLQIELFQTTETMTQRLASLFVDDIGLVLPIKKMQFMPTPHIGVPL